MAIQTQGSTGNVMEVDTAFKAARTSIRPPEVLGWNSLGVQTGGLTGIAASAAVFSFRNIAANPIMVRRIGAGFITTTAFTAAQQVEFGLIVGRSWSVSDTGGTPIAVLGSNGKHRTSLATPTSLDCRVSAAAALTAGTRTLDANTMSQQAGWSAGVGTTIVPAQDNLFQHATGDYPLILAQNEGFIIQNLFLMGAGGAGKLHLNMEFAEALSY